MTDDRVEWLTAQLDDDERWAQEASRDGDRYTPTGEHWRWECEATDTPATIDPMLATYVEGVDGAPVGLRSIEEYPTTWGASIPHLIIRGQDELEATVAGHIARHDPARVLRRVAVGREILAKYQGALMQEAKRPDDQVLKGYLIAMSQAVSALTTEYNDRPGYRPEWGTP